MMENEGCWLDNHAIYTCNISWGAALYNQQKTFSLENNCVTKGVLIMNILIRELITSEYFHCASLYTIYQDRWCNNWALFQAVAVFMS